MTPVRRLLRIVLIGACALASAVLFAGPAAADTTTYLRLAHLSPDTPEVDVYVASVADPNLSILVLPGVDYGTLSDYQALPSGQYVVSMRPAGAAPSTQPVIATTLSATTGSAYTVAGVGPFADLGLTVLTDDLSLPPAGQARARVIQASASEPMVDISVLGGGSLGEDVEFATTTPYRNVTAGEWKLRVTADSQTLAEIPITVQAGAVYSILILDTPSGLALGMQVDATAPTVVPAGAVETGGGGLVTGGSAAGWFPTAALLVWSGIGLIALAGLLVAGGVGRPRARLTE